MTSLRGHRSELETDFGLLLNELQLIWDEVGEGDEERDQMLTELELECLEVYRRKVNEANHSRANFHKMLADIHTEIVVVASELGDHPPMVQLENRGIPLKEQLANLRPILLEITRKKDERMRLFQEIREQMQGIQNEISPSSLAIDSAHKEEQDLTSKKLEELRAQLLTLQKEKNDRLYKVMGYIDRIHDLCKVLNCDFLATIREVHPSLENSCGNEAKSISDETIERLSFTIEILREEKSRRMQQVQDLGASLLEIWNLLDTPVAEQHPYQHVTCNIAAAEHEFVTAGALSLCVIEQAQAEVKRLEDLKASKMKELVLKKRTELAEICRRAHIVLDENSNIASMESGMVDPTELLANIEEEIGTIKEEAFSRKDIMEKIEKWLAACEEETWLDEYNKDENRYNATRGAHLNLKRAERARVIVNKIPGERVCKLYLSELPMSVKPLHLVAALLDSLVSKTTTWEEERGKLFLYDGVRLLSTIDEYKISRMEKEDDKRRQRDKKRMQEQSVNEQETLFGRANPNGRTPLKKGVSSSRLNAGSTPTGSRRSSLGGTTFQQESSVVARLLNGTTPGRNASTPKKEDKTKLTQAPISANGRLEMEDHSIPIPISSTGAQINETLVQSALLRMPLSPVVATGVRSNTNTEAHPTFIPVKTEITTVKGQLIRTLTTIVDEENTPLEQGASHEQQMLQPQQSPPLQQSVPHAQQSQEYSFEERRLAFMQHHELQHASSWTDCRQNYGL